jgi:hypothetical protein
MLPSGALTLPLPPVYRDGPFGLVARASRAFDPPTSSHSSPLGLVIASLPRISTVARRGKNASAPTMSISRSAR